MAACVGPKQVGAWRERPQPGFKRLPGVRFRQQVGFVNHDQVGGPHPINKQVRLLAKARAALWASTSVITASVGRVHRCRWR